jgi:hypothetical protein
VDIVAHPSFKNGGAVNPKTLIAAGLIRDESRDLKILGDMPAGGLKSKLDVTASRVSRSAVKAIQDAGGKVQQTGTRRDKVRGVDPNSEDRSPKNLTKKLKRGKKAGKTEAKTEAKAEGKAEGKGEAKA